MNYSTAIFLVNSSTRAVMCNYEPDVETKTYMFKTLDPTIQKGDFVVVPTNTRHGMTVCKVTDVDVDVDFDSAAEMKWVVGKVDKTAYEKLLTNEKQVVSVIHSAETRRKRDELRQALAVDAAALKDLPLIAGEDGAAPAA